MERNPGPSTQEIMDRVWRKEQAIDSVVREQSKALERERMHAEEVNVLKDEVRPLRTGPEKRQSEILRHSRDSTGVLRSVCAESS